MSEEPTKLTITHHVAGQGGRYVAVVEGAAEEGYLEWEPGGKRGGRDVRIAAHTIVPRAIGGRFGGPVGGRCAATGFSDPPRLFLRCQQVFGQP